jgi:hypothetical protein
VQRLFYGPPSALAAATPPEDLRPGQLAVLWPLAVLMLTMGLVPSLWLQSIEKGVHPPPTRRSGFSPTHAAGAKASLDSSAFEAGWKMRPDAMRDLSANSKTSADFINREGQR